MARRAGLLATLWLLVSGCGRPPLEAALAELAKAERCDRALEGAADPETLARQREAAYLAAETHLRALPAASAEQPAARLAAATLAWNYRQDLSAALRQVNAAIATLDQSPAAALDRRQSGGRSGRQLLAAALAYRAGLLLSAYTNPSDAGARPDVVVPAGPLDQAAADAKRAAALDPQAPYQTLLASIQRFAAPPLAAGPLDPGALQERPAVP